MTVLFADIAGSTQLYERHGNEVARDDIAQCLSLLSAVATRKDGRVVKTIGDEIMCAFRDPQQAAVAAGDMQSTLHEASSGRRFRTGTLRIKVAWHHGFVAWRAGDVLGEAPVIARQVIRLAKPEEVLTSGASLNRLPAPLRHGAKLIDRIRPELGNRPLDVYAMPWGDAEDITEVSPSRAARAHTPKTELLLKYAGRVLRVESMGASLRLGRARDNDLAVDGFFASRHHAEITFRRGRFRLLDNSTNGTIVICAGDKRRATRVHREEMPLPAAGWICLGLASDELRGKAIRFRHKPC